jgi:hypothetical protein
MTFQEKQKIIVSVAFLMAKLGIVDGYSLEYDKTYDQPKDTVHGPGVGFTFVNEFIDYWEAR